MSRLLRLSWLAVLVVGVAGATGPVVAQEATPQPAATALALLPRPETLGQGWTLLDTPGFGGLSPAAFRDGANAIYGGPDGARVLITVLLVAEGRPAIRESWVLANSTIDNYRTQLDAPIGDVGDLDRVPPPAGCAQVRRVVGRDRVFDAFPVGMTLCAADPDVIVLAVASGDVAGLSGYQASDFAVSITLAGGEADATPVAAAGA